MSSSSSNPFCNSRGMAHTPNLFCYCGDKMSVRTSWTKANPGRRFLSCPNYGSLQKCNMFHFLDDELPNQYYKDLVYQLHTQNGNDNHVSEHEDTQNELLKIMEDLSITKSNLKVYDRMMMCLVIVVMCLVVVLSLFMA
ncbi:hypothetical protein OSB04_019112 [Centaurea solstitialis]|uniref:GRF-type domain-containing protein n=1 Tax=Centaurea solstitialis TaxID=347529 RepID=A0AA38SPP2_9ASTR|nr:hypothetical protein OSB04_019112 [Centaurea solstitialis]